MNPVDAGLIDLQQTDLNRYTWSSYPAQAGAPSNRPQWLAAERLMNSFGIADDSISGRRAFIAYVTERGLSLQLKNFSKDDAREWSMMERGWVHGCAEFREAMIALLEEQGPAPRAEAGGQQRDIGASAGQKALEKGLTVLRLERNDLIQLKKVDERKLLLAGWLRSYFPVSTRWCTEQPHMGHPSTNTRAWNFHQNPPQKWRAAKKKLVNIVDFFG